MQTLTRDVRTQCAHITFETIVSGTRLTQFVEVLQDEMNELISQYYDYGWRICKFESHACIVQY